MFELIECVQEEYMIMLEKKDPKLSEQKAIMEVYENKCFLGL